MKNFLKQILLPIMISFCLFFVTYYSLVVEDIEKHAFKINEVIKNPHRQNILKIDLARQDYFVDIKHVKVGGNAHFYINDTPIQRYALKQKKVIKTVCFLLSKNSLRGFDDTLKIIFDQEVPPDIDIMITNYRKRLSDDLYLFFKPPPLEQPAKRKVIFNFALFYSLGLLLLKFLFPRQKSEIFLFYLKFNLPVLLFFLLFALGPPCAGFAFALEPFLFWMILLVTFFVFLAIAIFKTYLRSWAKIFKTRESMSNIVVFFAATTVLFFISEMATRVYINHHYKNRIFELADLDLSYRFKPNSQVEFSGVFVKINSLGLRDRQLSSEKPPGTKRIICLGDSITFGYGVAGNQAYPGQLQEILGTKGYEVVNCGVTAYNTYQERLFLERYGLKLKPDIIIAGICLNDIGAGTYIPGIVANTFIEPNFLVPPYLTRRFKDLPLVTKSEFIILRQSFFAQYLFLKFRALCSNLKWFSQPMVEGYAKESIYFYKGILNENRKKAQANFCEDILEMDRIARANKAKLLLVVFPNEIQLDMDDLRYPQRFIADFCRQNNIAILDLLPYFKRYTEKEIFIDLGHPSPLGHRVAAEAISEFLPI